MECGKKVEVQSGSKRRNRRSLEHAPVKVRHEIMKCDGCGKEPGVVAVGPRASLVEA